MLTDAQRDVLRRLAEEGAKLQPEVDTCGAPYEVLTHVSISTKEVDALDAAGLIEVTLWHDGPRMYEITPAGRAALGEDSDDAH